MDFRLTGLSRRRAYRLRIQVATADNGPPRQRAFPLAGMPGG